LLTTALLTATAFLAATTALFLAFALLAFTFLSLAISLLAALLPGTRRLARFVRIVLCFHSTFHCYYYWLVTGLYAVSDQASSFLEIAL
jgi:hypothetical protein